MATELRRGIRRAGPVTTLGAAGAANAVEVFQISNFAQQVGTKTIRLKKIFVQPAGADNINIGTGVGGAFAALIPAVTLVAGLDNHWQEFELPEVESAVDITCYGDAVGAHIVQLEVEEVG